MIQMADEALYECKRNGRNCVASKLPEAATTPVAVTWSSKMCRHVKKS